MGTVLYTSGEQNNIDGEPGFKNQNWGITLGVDVEMDPSIRMGLATSIVRGSVDGNEGSNNTSYGYLATLYSSWSQRGYFVDTMVSMGNTVNDMNKRVDNQKVSANFGVDQWGFRMVGGKSWRIGNWNMSPQAELNYGMVRTENIARKATAVLNRKSKAVILLPPNWVVV